MIKSLSMCSFLQVLVFVTCSLHCLAQQPTCQSNDCNGTQDGCCSASDYCSTERTLIKEHVHCNIPFRHLPSETPLVHGLEHCPFNFLNIEYESCSDSYVDDPSKSLGNYGKPNWVGAEFQSISYDTFSVTVIWEHIDGDIQLSLRNQTAVQGYEIRIYRKESGKPDQIHECFCVMDPSMRNISDIRNSDLTYREMSHMIIEVRAFPSLNGQNERNTRRNCSLLAGCTITEDCPTDCYSWPQSCLSFLPSYDPRICAPPLYGPPVNVTAVKSLVNNNVTGGIFGKLELSWEPPRMNYELFPLPSIYYITISNYDSMYHLKFKAVKTTNVNILYLNTASTYFISVEAYVPCSGLGLSIMGHQGLVGCGLESNETKVIIGNCAPPTPPLYGVLGKYQSTSLHSTVTFQCDSGWAPSGIFTTTCISAGTDRLEWVPDPVNHTCSGML